MLPGTVLLSLHARFLRLVTKPPAPSVRCLMNGYAVNPRLQAGSPVKLFHSAEHFEENFLRSIRSIPGIGKNSVNEAVNGLVKFAHQPGVCVLRSRLELGDDTGLF